jgi:hypothetical protein
MIGPGKFFYVWTSRIEAYLLHVVMGRRQGSVARTTRAALWGLSKIFIVAVKVRREIYRHEK